MNHNRESPMWGGNIPGQQIDTASNEIMAHTSDEILTNYGHLRNSSPSPSNFLTDVSLMNIQDSSLYKKPNNDCRLQDLLSVDGRRNSAYFEDIHGIISREMQDCQINCVQNNTATHEVVNNLLYARPKKDIPFEVVGAQAGYVLKVGLRYLTGAFHDKPVLVCKNHADENDKDISFYVPKFKPRKVVDAGNHIILEIPVPTNENSENFCFSIVFRCLNSCHREYGKSQEIILQLYDRQNNQLKECRIPVRVCKNVNRDKRPRREKKHSGRKAQGPPLKKVKQEPKERDEMQTDKSVLPLFLGRKHCCKVVITEPVIPLFTELLKFLKAEVQWMQEGDEDDGSASDTLSQ